MLQFMNNAVRDRNKETIDKDKNKNKNKNKNKTHQLVIQRYLNYKRK